MAKIMQSSSYFIPKFETFAEGTIFLYAPNLAFLMLKSCFL